VLVLVLVLVLVVLVLVLLIHRRLLYFFLTKISEIYKGSPYTGGACPPKQGHEPVPIN
jgi:hypothetical protein